MKINEVAKQLQTSTWTLRYYEQIGVMAPVARINGIRDYSVADVNRLREVLELRQCGVKLAEIKQLIKLEVVTQTTQVQRQLLQGRAVELRSEIRQLQGSLSHLEAKIATLPPDERELISGGNH
ncbi:MerR family transcriptional regulator [Levilactobacillus tujiorum]|uniref:MerR family transcriptional regulator n=1 Tax=Levilactobacillus tujiorum TaxID=2912243 RepID=UPI001456412C|nr:MerR family transcriptional regulator [Levilactobacillus tujiorum]